MSRPLRIEFPGRSTVYHVTSRGERRESIFEDDADRRVVLADQSGTDHGFSLNSQQAPLCVHIIDLAPRPACPGRVRRPLNKAHSAP